MKSNFLKKRKQSSRIFFVLSSIAILGLMLVPASPGVFSEEFGWPQFRGPDSNPIGTSVRLADRWSKTENVEWSREIQGRGWTSPIVTRGKVYLTTAVTEGKSKSPQTGTEYSNEYVAELQKQGLPMEKVIEAIV